MKVTLPLTNGNAIVKDVENARVYDIVEHVGRKLRLSGTFPFFRFDACKYVSFKYREIYRAKCYRVLLDLNSFCTLLGIEYEPYEKHAVRSSLTNYYQSTAQ